MKTHLCSHSRFECERGISTVFLGLIFFSFLAFLGFAVDVANLHRTQHQLQASVDNMSLFLVNQIEDRDYRRLSEIAKQGIEDNLSAKGLVGYTLADPIIELVPEDAPRQVNITAEVTLPLRILGMVPTFGDTATVRALASAVSKRMVTVVVADVSNSMVDPADPSCTGTCPSKLEKLKEGLIQFLTIISPKPEDYFGIVTFSGSEAEIAFPLQRDIDNQSVIDFINSDPRFNHGVTSTYQGTPTWHAFKLAHGEFDRVAALTTILPTDVVTAVAYTDGRPVGTPQASQITLPYPCTAFSYDNTYPMPTGYSTTNLTNLAHNQMLTINEADQLRLAVHGVKILSLGVGASGVVAPNSWECNFSDNTYGSGRLTKRIGDPFECANNQGKMLQVTLTARLANDADYFARYFMTDTDPYQTGLQPPLDFPSCLTPSTTVPGPRGQSAVFTNSDQLNDFLANYGESIKNALIM